ncbi:MAG TPA: hypothetical protein VGT81_16445, partial [Casimicrobiaceae bacterium]|nr:hypothetical protein [Casimicrobiaceae bacterium]
MDRKFAGARRTEFADHQRSRCRDSLDQRRADRRSPRIAKITKRPNLLHHDNPPFKTGSENRHANRFTSQMCEHGSVMTPNEPIRRFTWGYGTAKFEKQQNLPPRHRHCTHPAISKQNFKSEQPSIEIDRAIKIL